MVNNKQTNKQTDVGYTICGPNTTVSPDIDSGRSVSYSKVTHISSSILWKLSNLRKTPTSALLRVTWLWVHPGRVHAFAVTAHPLTSYCRCIERSTPFLFRPCSCSSRSWRCVSATSGKPPERARQDSSAHRSSTTLGRHLDCRTMRQCIVGNLARVCLWGWGLDSVAWRWKSNGRSELRVVTHLKEIGLHVWKPLFTGRDKSQLAVTVLMRGREPHDVERQWTWE